MMEKVIGEMIPPEELQRQISQESCATMTKTDQSCAGGRGKDGHGAISLES